MGERKQIKNGIETTKVELRAGRSKMQMQKTKTKYKQYFSSITQGVIAHSPEPEAHDQSVRRNLEVDFCRVRKTGEPGEKSSKHREVFI